MSNERTTMAKRRMPKSQKVELKPSFIAVVPTKTDTELRNQIEALQFSNSNFQPVLSKASVNADIAGSMLVRMAKETTAENDAQIAYMQKELAKRNKPKPKRAKKVVDEKENVTQ